jgi:cytochrome c biogenesis protein CcmG/thiol:disulfide interchange protein DsbE
MRRRRMLAPLFAGALLATSCSSGSGHHPAATGPAALSPSVPAPPGASCPQPGSPAASGHTTAFAGITLSCLRTGPPVHLDALGGRRPVLVNLWASWCIPCQREMPRVQRVSALTQGRLLVLGIDTEDSDGSARSFLRAVAATYPELVDHDGLTRIQLHAVGLPASVLVAADGTVAYRKLGEMKPADLISALGRVGITLSGSAVAGT